MISLKDFIFPPLCFICGEPLPYTAKKPYICKNCSIDGEIVPINYCQGCAMPLDIKPEYPICPYCNGEKLPFKVFVSPFYNKGGIRESVLNFKFNRSYSNAITYAHYLKIRLDKLKDFNPQVIVPAPSSRRRIAKRGFNHIMLIAKHLSKELDIPIADILVKNIHTKPQSTLSKKERLTNLKNAFSCKKHSYTSVLLIDDIYTTGATVEELCKTLKKSRVKEIYVATVARSYEEKYD